MCSQLDVSSDILTAVGQRGAGSLDQGITASSTSSASKLQLEASSAVHVVNCISGDGMDWQVTIDNGSGMLSRCGHRPCVRNLNSDSNAHSFQGRTNIM